MSELRLSFPANVIAGKGKINARDVAMLKADLFPEGVMDAEGAVLLFALHASCRETCPEWADFFVNALTRFIIDECHPKGTLDETNAFWLERMLAADGVIASPLELRLLNEVIARADHVPDSLKVFALSQIRHALHDGHGAYAQSRSGPLRGIGADDMDYARRIIEAGTEEGDRQPSAALHRVLLAIDAVTQPGLNEPGWVRLLFTVRPRAPAPRRRAPRIAA
ncbi:hypothetical protein [Gellertiella hungarica]|uniref:Uncharacterized protein n=1 Tax=Gellertiella hungarica TaxID=1572859 RepID=A0A7W6J6N1_9HYPH|nr:hypothetical protein [Gellertiella hungarica]MBB4064893.1 hypothetical protein [Gellertiella hungarica]